MATPQGQPLAFALFEVASAYDCPQRVAGKHTATRLDLVVNVHKSSETPDPAADALFQLEPPWIYIQAVACDMPPARKDEACTRRRVVEDRLSCSGRVVVGPPGDQHGKYPVAPCDRILDDLAIVGRSRKDSDVLLERVELADAALPAHPNHLVAPV